MVATVISDTHIHVYDARFPTSPEAVIHSDDALVGDYVRTFPDIRRVVVVQPSAYGLDNRCQLEAMAEFERNGVEARGVMVVDASTSTAEIARLDGLGVRGARFHMLPGGAVPWDHLGPVSEAIAEFSWHIQLQLNGRELPDRLGMLRELPTGLVIDHVGRFMPPVTPDSREAEALSSLLETGRTWVKLSAPYESSTDLSLVEPLANALIERFPDRLLWASNWPHPGRNRNTPAWIPPGVDEHACDRNAAAVYGFGS